MATDVDGDGNLDLVCANGYADNFSVLTNDGRGALVLASSPPVGSGPYTFAAADVNGDGKVDLISANSDDKTLTILTNDGRGGFVTACTLMQEPIPIPLSPRDLDGDGKLELVCANPTADTITILTNDGQGGFALAFSLVVGGKDADRVTAADVDGDGKLDLVVADSNGNQLWVLINTTPFAPPTSTPRLNIASGQQGFGPVAFAFGRLVTATVPGPWAPNWSPAGYGSQESLTTGKIRASPSHSQRAESSFASMGFRFPSMRRRFWPSAVI